MMQTNTTTCSSPSASPVTIQALVVAIQRDGQQPPRGSGGNSPVEVDEDELDALTAETLKTSKGFSLSDLHELWVAL